jgi:hypothetical protein
MADLDDRRRDDIARRAYERYEARGREDGHDQEDWFEAEREAQNRERQNTERRPAGRPSGGREAGVGSIAQGE